MNDQQDNAGGAGDGQQPPTPPTPPTPPPPEAQAPPPPGPAAPPPPGGAAVEQDSDARMWGMLCHLTALCGLVIPFANFIVPLIIWQIKKEQAEFIDDQGKESLNFQITIAIVGFVVFILSWIPIVQCFTLPLLVLLIIPWLVFTIIGGLKANNGERYRYPWTLRLVS